MKIVLIVVSVIVGIIFTAIMILYFAMPNMEPDYKTKKITFNNSDEVLFFKTSTWGISADHWVSVLSANSENEIKPDSTKGYVYKEPSFTFYRTYNDTLWLYVYSKAPVPKLFDSKIKVIQVELENPDMMKIRQTNLYQGKFVHLIE